MTNRAPRDLRSLLLAIQVIEDIDLVPTLVGVRLPGGHEVALHHVRAAARGMVATDEGDRRALAAWLRTVQRLAAMPTQLLRDMCRPVGLPPGHPVHPGDGWVCEALLGGAIDLGIGVLGLDPDRPELVEVFPATVWDAIGFDPMSVWPRCRRQLEEMGALAARRWELSTDGRLLPMGDCDVVTLLGSASLRQAMVAGYSTDGMRTVAVPMRHSRVDSTSTATRPGLLPGRGDG